MQVDGGRPRGVQLDDPRLHRLHGLCAGGGVHAVGRQHHTECRGNADGRRAAHHQVANRLAYLVAAAAVQVLDRERKFALVQQ